MSEIWLPVKDFEGRYEVSDKGNIRSLVDSHLRPKTPTIKKQLKNKFGYMVVALYRDKMFCKKVHRLVAEAFIPNPENKPFVNHKDCDKTNNHVNNIEWVTARENVTHARKNGRFPSFKGMNSPIAIWTDSEVISIKDDINNGLSSRQLYDKYPKLNPKHLYLFRVNKTWPHLDVRVTKINKSRRLISDEIRDEIRAYKQTNNSAFLSDIGEKFGVSETTVFRILKE